MTLGLGLLYLRGHSMPQLRPPILRLFRLPRKGLMVGPESLLRQRAMESLSNATTAEKQYLSGIAFSGST
jgi:hypothetical protein